ncbi:MAG: TorF family putative porin [Gammaproteobacteria bacterium]|nr:TorF family putative porin [Gammaproteobacteria bacterium]MBU1482605.1 TorF family putative porin [Gammaproteobacteria bacterium]
MLMNKLLVAALATAFALPALAEETSPFSGNVSLTTNYLYRGVSQTGNRGAIQGGLDYANANGVYVGAWGSNISWLTDSGAYSSGASLELDTYGGYRGAAGDVSYDVGFLRYNYSGEHTGISANTNELYGAVGYKWVTAKYSRSFTDLFGVPDSKGSTYLELNGSYTLEEPGITLGAHYGKQTVAGTGNDGLTYSDYNVKASKDFGGYGLGILINKTNITGDKTRYVLSVSHSM